MNPLSETSKVKTMVVLLALCAAVISVAAAPANAYDYRAKFTQMAGWLATQQRSGGGIQESETNTAVETDNTQEAIWIWSRYAELTGDYTTYQTNINNAWTYCLANPAWLEGSSATNYYTTYNIGWGLDAEMEYRHVYQGRAGYVDHSSYGTTCANTEVSNTPGTGNATDALCLGRSVGSLYQYGVDVGNATYKARAVTLGGNVRTWFGTSNFGSQGWAVSAGVGVWGVLNSYYKDPNNASGAAAWAGTANTYMPASDTGTGDGYQNGHNAWYAWGHYAISEHRSDPNYQTLCDTLLSKDGDLDGGIPQQGSTAADFAWTTNATQAAISMGGLLAVQNYTISGTVTYSSSPLSGVTMSGLSGNPVTDASGVYSAQVGSGWSGTVTPTKTGYTFTPATRTYSNVTANQTAQNYTATPALPGKATTPSPAHTATNVSLTADLIWTAGSGATSHIVYFGTTSPGTLRGEQAGTTYDTGTMSANTTYYWRIDEKNAGGTTTGDVWSFTTVPPPPAQATTPSPANTATNVGVTTDIGWTAGSGATSHDVYFGTTSPGTFRGNQAGTTYDTGTMNANTTYYWRIDEKNAGGTTTGTVWNFTTQTAPPALPWSDGFESGDFITGGWTPAGTASVTTAAAYTGTYGAYIPGGGSSSITKSLSTVGFNTIYVKYDRKLTHVLATLVVDWSTDGSTWNVLETLTGSTAWASQNLLCASGADNNAGFRVRFRVTSTNGSRNAYIDNVQITGTAIPATTTVPNVVGQTQAAATTAITGAGLIVGTVTNAYSDTVAAGLVISQAPASGTVVYVGSAVNLVISLGKPTVPNVVGSTQAAATAAITAVDNLTVGTVTQAYSNTVAAGLVISQNPVGGTQVNTGSAVNLVISLGKPTVPNVVGSTQAVATAAIIAVDNLVVGTVTQQYSNTVAAGNVISQNPVGGTQVNIGSNVAIVVSLGMPTVLCIVGLPCDEVDEPIIASGFVIGLVSYQYSDTVPAGFVMSQNPACGTQVPSGSGIDFVCSLGRPVVPNVVGMTQAAASAAITAVDSLMVGTVATAYSNTVAAGLVISQNPVGGTQVNTGSAVNLVISLGKPTVPNVVGSTQAVATAAIIAVDNLVVGTVTQQYSNTVAAGLVISQNPVGGTQVNTGSSVDMVISLGSAPRIISGYITEPDANIPVEGVVVNANNGGGSDATDANGYYELTVDYGWSGTVEPNKTGYTFEPNSINYSNVTTDQTNQDYTATLLTYVISGYVLDSNDSSPIDGVLMSGLPGDPCTNGSGYYSAVVDYGWSGTVTPTKYAYAFEPNSRSYANVTADQTGQDYAGTLLTYGISGCILDLNDIPIDSVLVSANNGGGLDTTDPNGYYEVWVSYNWSGTVTPTDGEYTFAPANRPYSNVLADQTNQDYVGTSIYDLYPDGIIDLLDLEILCENWLTTGPGDFDNDGTVDFRDFAEFALVW